MNNWSSEGIIISIKPFQEKQKIITVFTEHFGIQTGFMRTQKKDRISVLVKISARTTRAGINYFSCENSKNNFFMIFGSKKKLLSLKCILETLACALPIAEPNRILYIISKEFILLLLTQQSWYSYFIFTELSILKHIGFELELSKCAITNNTMDLYYISPKTGRALSQQVGHKYHDKLLILPKNIRTIYYQNKMSEISIQDFRACFKVTNFFLKKHVFIPKNRDCSLRSFFINQFAT